ncbi:MAG TPA: PAS domain S-box protein [Acidimicrobiales bacterium]|nr:PAS domain S-box protein [Acidimicrobiales bacterium]
MSGPPGETPRPLDLSLLVSNLADPVAVIDQSGTLLWANRAAELLFGESSSPLIGRSVLELLHPEDMGVSVASLDSVRNKAQGTPIEVRVRTTSGWKLVEIIGANQLHEPAIAGIVLSIRDLTERRRWEVASSETARFRALVHNASTVLMLLDPTGRVSSVSAAITRLLGHDQELVEGRPLAQLVREEDREDLELAITRALEIQEGGVGSATAEVEMLDRDRDRTVPFELNMVNLVDDPTVGGLVVSGHDISRLRASLTQLEDAHAKLIRQERLSALGELASVIGHELRNPLGAATNFLFLARHRLGEDIDPEVDRYLSMVERQTNRAAALSEDLTAYVREHEPEPVHLQLGAVVDEVFEATPPPTGIDVVVEVPHLTLEADPIQLTQMLTNLVMNAYQAMPAGGSLLIGVSESPGSVEITVQDSGEGIAPEVAARVFDPFFTTKPEGTGLGLAIVQRLAEAHGGGVLIENASTRGAVAKLRLPRHSARNDR